ncbi:phosphodiester glycosidase family protein [Terrarubrum flagellatum]|uniref:phosphodiester glycosidase family protein n=1 Tax=Terrirubrum flagellatum TaxID=2895980 RepID=UPI003144E8CC
MMRRLIFSFFVFFTAAAPALANCEPVADRGKSYTVCTFSAGADAIRLFWKDGDGRAFGSLDHLAEKLAARGERLAFAMNAGMYEEDLSPVGLYVENGRQLRGANLRNGSGNFHLKPNGVFYIGRDGAGVMETARYLREKPPAIFATQSGPMLVVNGAVHPKIRDTGVSEKIRNGVGVRDGRTVVFAISREPVTFHDFAALFRDRLKTPDALFLDGSISSLYAPPQPKFGGLRAIGPIVGVVEAAR